MNKATRTQSRANLWARLRDAVLVLLGVCACTGIVHAGPAASNPAEVLRSKYAASAQRLSQSPFQRPLYLDSSESSGRVTGDIYALLDYPLATATAALSRPDNWCDILLLHLNTKYCRAAQTGQQSVLNLWIGKKHDQPLDDAYQMNFAYQVVAKTENYLQVRLNAEKGPLSTRNYLIVIEAIAAKNGQTFMHISYSYASGVAGRLAMQTYLGTIGRNKVGFTVVGIDANRQPRLVDGMRGVVERTTMRYYLAIEAFLGALSEPKHARPEKRFRDWYAASERYPRQLHELEQSEYLDMKRREFRRQSTETP